jgi:hypothetical protein
MWTSSRSNMLMQEGREMKKNRSYMVYVVHKNEKVLSLGFVPSLCS